MTLTVLLAAGAANNDRYGPHIATALARAGIKAALNFDNQINADVEKRFAGTDGAGVDAEALARPDDNFVDLYVAYLNAPSTGRAILGEAGHADLLRRLEPGQHAWWVASAGRDAYIDEGFTRGTVPPRLAFSQGGAPVELRDLDLSPAPPKGAPPLNAALVLRVPPMSGIDPASPVRFELTLTRARGSMLPVLTQRSVSLDYQAPEALFFRPPAPFTSARYSMQ